MTMGYGHGNDEQSLCGRALTVSEQDNGSKYFLVLSSSDRHLKFVTIKVPMQGLDHNPKMMMMMMMMMTTTTTTTMMMMMMM